ncbi:penicillin-binding protein activator [Sphingomonas mesophila]|uniref:penicillin-binding protein activator n=1 Tax=Sphingomonas mesophila TaxID=2303576 RepID=UPI001F072831|nr:penicillin-binding protein activator [Sphingomonas mesophila]
MTVMTLSPDRRQARRGLLLGLGAAALVLAGCQSRGPVRPVGPVGPVEPGPMPDSQRHLVALILPLSGPDSGVATSIANAANLALFDTKAGNLRLTTFDSGRIGAAAAANQALAAGADLILGPLLAEDVRAMAPTARRARVPVIAFSNDQSVAGNGIYIMGVTPAASIDRVVRHARGRGAARFGALIPSGLYGQRAAQALSASVRASGGTLVATETYNRNALAARGAAALLNRRGTYDAVLIGDGGGSTAMVAPGVEAGPTLLGTELWASDRSLGRVPRLRGALYAAPPEARFQQLVTRYRARYGKVPYRLGSLGYDAMLLAARAARSWPVGRPFPARLLADREGFAGVDGIFRFSGNGVIERALEVRQVTAAGTLVVSPAATQFAD